MRTAVTFFDVLRFAAGYWRRRPGALAFCVLLFLIASTLETNLPNALSAFLAAIRTHAQDDAIYRRLGFFICNYFAFIVLRNSAFRIYNIFEVHVFKELIDDAFAQVHRLSETFFVNTFTGSIISKITRARTRIETFEDQIFLRILPTSIVLTGSITFLALRFPVLAALMAGYLILLVALSGLAIVRLIGPSQAAYAEAQDSTTAHLADSISGIATTKAYAQEERENIAFRDITETLRVKNRRAYLAGNMVGLIQSLLLGGMLTLLLGGGTWYFMQGRANVEDMAYLTLAYTIMHSYLRELSFNIKDLLVSSYDLHAIVELLNEIPGVRDAAGARPLAIPTGGIEFKNVTFTYPGKPEPVFKNLSVSIRAGERVALVGHSGSGKTSFVRLVQRAYDIQSGGIFVDGQDVGQGTLASLRSSIALVPQDPILFHRSLSENIAYARPSATMEEIRAAARQANIDDFIEQLPEKYETLVGERGVKLSGGERQRVAIARAILADRPILILDEATSSLDSASEKAIQGALLKLTHGRTSIMIAHRLSTVLDADRILVFDKGAIAEEGTHAQLVARGGIYAGFFRLQSGGFLGDEEAQAASDPNCSEARRA